MEINRLVLPVRGGLADSSETTAAKGRARFRYLEETHSVKDPREEGMEAVTGVVSEPEACSAWLYGCCCCCCPEAPVVAATAAAAAAAGPRPIIICCWNCLKSCSCKKPGAAMCCGCACALGGWP